MPPRNAPKACRTCPTPKKPAPATPTATGQAYIPPPLTVTDGLRLWKHVLFGTATCISMIEGYAADEMPGDPIDGVKYLRDRLQKVIQLLEDRAHAHREDS